MGMPEGSRTLWAFGVLGNKKALNSQILLKAKGLLKHDKKYVIDCYEDVPNKDKYLCYHPPAEDGYS